MTASIQVNSGGQLAVSGVLTFATVNVLRQRGNQLMAEQDALVFDLKQVSFSDSSGVALLTAWGREAKRLDKSIRFVNLPTQLFDIAQVCGLAKILPIS